jgi:hypothetical protein
VTSSILLFFASSLFFSFLKIAASELCTNPASEPGLGLVLILT